MSTIHLTSENFEEIVGKKGTIALVDFYADWCGPCKMFAPVFEETSNEITDVVFAKVNVDNEEILAMRYDVMSIPTVVLFKDGEPIRTNVGLAGKAKLIEMINLAKN